MTNKRDVELQRFLKNIVSIDKTRKNLEGLLVAKKISKKDIEHAYRGFFLEIVSGFESVIESIFIDFLLENNKIRSKVVFKDKRISSVRMILFNGKKYYNWLPYNYTIQLGDMYFYKNHPFASLGFNSQDQFDIVNAKKVLDQILQTRNAIAHKSDHSKKKFLKSIEGITLRSTEKTPIAFLRSSIRSSPDQNRYEYFILEISAFVKRFMKIR